MESSEGGIICKHNTKAAAKRERMIFKIGGLVLAFSRLCVPRPTETPDAVRLPASGVHGRPSDHPTEKTGDKHESDEISDHLFNRRDP